MNIKRKKTQNPGNTAVPKMREPLMRGPIAENPLAQRVRASDEPDTIDLDNSDGFHASSEKEPPTRVVEAPVGKAFDWN